jgi:hypothetical protein
VMRPRHTADGPETSALGHEDCAVDDPGLACGWRHVVDPGATCGRPLRAGCDGVAQCTLASAYAERTCDDGCLSNRGRLGGWTVRRRFAPALAQRAFLRTDRWPAVCSLPRLLPIGAPEQRLNGSRPAADFCSPARVGCWIGCTPGTTGSRRLGRSACGLVSYSGELASFLLNHSANLQTPSTCFTSVSLPWMLTCGVSSL